jgi:adenosylhomocysteine nucleosidase
MDLPKAVVHALNEQGQVEMSKLIRFLVMHPWELLVLIKLGIHFHAAQKTLKTTAKYLNEVIQF